MHEIKNLIWQQFTLHTLYMYEELGAMFLAVFFFFSSKEKKIRVLYAMIHSKS